MTSLFDYLSEKFYLSIQAAMIVFEGSRTFMIANMTFFILNVFFLLFFVSIRMLRTEVAKTRGMFKIIPLSLMAENPVIIKKLTSLAVFKPKTDQKGGASDKKMKGRYFHRRLSFRKKKY